MTSEKNLNKNEVKKTSRSVSPIVKFLNSKYKGERVVLFLGDSKIVIKENAGEVEVTNMIEGFVIKIDEEYVHLGRDKKTIYRSILRTDTKIIEKVSEDAISDEDLELFFTPEKIEGGSDEGDMH